MSFNLEDLQAKKEGFEGVEVQSSWSCHSCESITSFNSWDLSWNNSDLEICDNHFCRHVRCELCQNISSLDLPPQQDDIFTAKGVLTNDHLMDQLGDIESPETARKPQDTQLVPLQSEISTTEHLWASLDDLEVPEPTEGGTLDEIMQDLLSPKPSEAMMAAILKDLLEIHNDPEVFDIAEDITKTDIFRDSPQEDLLETPPPAPPLQSPTPPPPERIRCPHHHTHACKRTFQRAHHAHRHARIHTHHLPCPAPRCASRFNSQRSLRSHTARIHDVLLGIADLAASDKGPLVVDKGSDGKAALAFPCRFRAVLGCERRFGQNGHANRHALGHCGKAWTCGVGNCGLRFVVRANWEEHRWGVHGAAPWE